MAAKQFKDFHKEAKDLLSKNYTAPNSWKIEGKTKAPNEVITVNPAADKSGISADIEYNIAKHNLKTKMTVSNNGTIKPKVTYDINKDNKVDISLSSLNANAQPKLEYEGAVNGFVIADTLEKTKGSLAVSYPIAAFNVGVSASYLLTGTQFAIADWSVGGRWSDKGIVASVSTVAFQNFSASAVFPFAFGDYKFKFAAQADSIAKPQAKQASLVATVGFEVPLPWFTLRAKVDQVGQASIAVIRKFNSQWTVAVSTTSGVFAAPTAKDGVVAGPAPLLTKFGVHFTRE